MTQTTTISEVEKNSHLIKQMDMLFYTDNDNCEKWSVTDLFHGGFEATNGYETKDFLFNELQSGWSISEKTKEVHKQHHRFQYLA